MKHRDHKLTRGLYGWILRSNLNHTRTTCIRDGEDVSEVEIVSENNEASESSEFHDLVVIRVGRTDG